MKYSIAKIKVTGYYSVEVFYIVSTDVLMFNAALRNVNAGSLESILKKDSVGPLTLAALSKGGGFTTVNDYEV